MSRSKFYDKISKASIEREVEDIYNEGLALYFDNATITHPFACDGLIDTKEQGKLCKLIMEYKYDKDFKNAVSRASVIVQVLYYIKRFEENGLILPNICLVGDINECFVFHTNDIQKYLSYDLDWSIAPSGAHVQNPDLVLEIAKDEVINPFIFNIDENFSFKDVADKIKDLAVNVKRLVNVTEHNIAIIYEYFCNNVVKDAKSIPSNDLVAVFVNSITDRDSTFLHPKKKDVLVSCGREIHIHSNAYNSFFSYFNKNYTPQEKMKFTEIADRLIEDTERRKSGDFWTPTTLTDKAHDMISKSLGYDWKEKYVVWDNCCYDEQTMVFTLDGWKYFKDLQDDDLIYSLNPYYMKAEWVGFKYRQIIPFNGKLLHFSNNYVDLLVTENHKMFNSVINRNLKKSKKPKMDFFWSADETYNHISRGNSISQTISSGLMNIPEGNMEDFYIGCFIGFYLGDGYTQHIKGKPYGISFNLSKERKIEYINSLIEHLKLNVTKTKNIKKDGIRKDSILFSIKLSNNALDFIEPYTIMKTRDKFIPNDLICLMNKQIMLGIMDGLKNSDGTTHVSSKGDVHVIYSTYSRELMNSIEKICIRLGYYVKTFEYYRKDRDVIEYEVSYFENKYVTELYKSHINKEEYNGTVYDVTLNKNHILLVKRCGKMCFSGNCGTLNLTRDYRFNELYCSTLLESELEIGKQYNREATKFQFDFLNDSLDKLPKGLLYALKANKPIVFFLNPPYATANNMKQGTHKAGVAKTMINEVMLADKIGASSQNLYAQFLYRILMIKRDFNLTNCHIALFSPTLFLTGSSWAKFRTIYLNEFVFDNGVQFKASHFADCADSWGISFSIWYNGETTDKNNFNYTLIDKENGEIVEYGEKVVYNIDGLKTASDWVKEPIKGLQTEDAPQLSSAIKVKQQGCGKIVNGALGYYVNVSNNVYKNQTDVYIVSSCSSMGHGCSILPENFDKVCANFAARKLIETNWVNSKDEYLAPNTEHAAYNEFVNDSLIYSLFHSSSNQSSLRNVEYKNKKWDIKNEFFWRSASEMAELANACGNDEMYNDARTSSDRYVYEKLQGITLSPEAQAVLDKANEILDKTVKYRTIFDTENKVYQVNNWDASYYQLKPIWKVYAKEDFAEFQTLFKKLSEKMRPMVYELGFLK